MKNLVILLLSLGFSGNVFARVCNISSGNKKLAPNKSVTFEGCTELAVNEPLTQAKLKKSQSFKIEYSFEMEKGDVPEPYAYNIEMIVTNIKDSSSQLHSNSKPSEKR